ncbi:MAG: DUF2061 domain-containing protein [Nitrosopumilaceae archaeon]|nr:DUF2061 domain-containing protein [Nitrosopumilaceae archaeon]
MPSQILANNKRILAKTVLYRGIVTAILFAVSWIFTGNITDTTVITVTFNVLATIAYFLHEKMWDKIRWGIKPELGQPRIS